MEPLFRNRGPNLTVSLKNNHGTFLVASDNKKSLTLLSSTGLGSFIPKNAEWTIKFPSATAQFTEFSLWSIYNKELATQVLENGEIVVSQHNPNSSQPFRWRIYYSQPLSGGINLCCDCRDWISYFHKLSATQDGTITVKPSFEDTLLDPGSWWFIEVVEKSATETGSIIKHSPETGSTSSARQQPLAWHQQFTDMEQHKQQDCTLITPLHDKGGIRTHSCLAGHGPSYQFHAGMNSNGSGSQNVGVVKFKNKITVSNAGHGSPYSGFGSTSPEMHDGQLSYNTEQQPCASIPSNHNSGIGTHSTTSMGQSPGAPVIYTHINTGNNSNGSGTQTNNVSIKNKGPIYKYW